MFKYDRCISTRNFSRGRGVLTGIRKDISACSITVTEINFEHIFVRFSLDSINFIVGGVYIPPHSFFLLHESYISSFEVLIRQYLHDIFTIYGEYDLLEVT